MPAYATRADLRRALVPFFFVSFVAACGREVTSGTVEVRVIGTVTSAADASPLAGATVTLGAGGHFTFPEELATAQTNASGAYVVERLVAAGSGCRLWVIAQASGHATSSMEATQGTVSCTSGQQVRNLTLEPSP